MNRFTEIFRGEKAIIAMLHLKADEKMNMLERAKREIDIYYRNGLNAVLVENYFGSAGDCETVLAYLQSNYPDRIYGVNILGDYRLAFELAEKYGAKLIQIDSVCGHLPPEKDSTYGTELEELCNHSRAAVLGGVRFKYQSVRSGRALDEDLNISRSRCSAVVTTGDGTGIETPINKITQFRQLLGDFPFVVGAGVRGDTIAETLKYCDGVIIGSWLKDGHEDYGDVNENYVKEIVMKKRIALSPIDWKALSQVVGETITDFVNNPPSRDEYDFGG